MAASHKTPTQEPVTYDKIYESLCFARKYISHILLHGLRQKFGPFSGIRASVWEIVMQEGASFKVVKHLLLNPDDATRQCGTVDRFPGPLDHVIFILGPASNFVLPRLHLRRVLQSPWHRFVHNSKFSRMNSRPLVRDLPKRGTFRF